MTKAASRMSANPKIDAEDYTLRWSRVGEVRHAAPRLRYDAERWGVPQDATLRRI